MDSLAAGPEVGDPIIEVCDLHVRFGRQLVLRSIDLAVPRCQTLAIIGESGCGKTVLLKTIIGLVRPSQGSVRFDGQNVAELTDRQLDQQRLRCGLVFQNAALFDSMTVGQNVAFPLWQHAKLSGSEVRRRVYDRLEEVGLASSVASKRPAELSGGMRKRVGLARALVMDPEVLLYDEPTTGLDPIVSEVINALIVRTRERNSVTSIVITHDMRTVHEVADRVVMLSPLAHLNDKEPQVVYDGTPRGLDHSPDRRVRQFVAGWLDEVLLETRGEETERPDSTASRESYRSKRAA